MKLKLLLSLPILLISLCTVAQNYVIEPARTVQVTPVLDAMSIVDIFQVNTSNKTIILKWKLVSKDLNPGWDYSLCDYVTCYAGLPDSGTMTPVDSGVKGFLGLNLNPRQVYGTGSVKMYVYEEGFFEKGDTLTWEILMPTGIHETKKSNILSLYPNPAADKVTVRLAEYNNNSSIRIIDILGNTVAQRAVSSELTTLDVGHLSNGYYFIQCKQGNEIVGISRLCVSN
jgi:hypothetical protein